MSTGAKPVLQSAHFICHILTGIHSQPLYKPQWHSSMMMPSAAHNSWIQQFTKPPLVSVPPSQNYNHPSQHPQQQQQSPQSSYPPTPPKDDMRASSENDGTYTPTSNSGFVYATDYQGNTGSVFKHNTSSNSQTSSTTSPQSKSKARSRTGTGTSSPGFALPPLFITPVSTCS